MRTRPPTCPAWLDTAAGLSWRFLLVGAAGLVVVSALDRLAVVVLPLIGAVFLSVILSPPARWLRRRGWAPLPAAFTVFLLAGLFVVSIGWWVVPRLAVEIGPLRDKLGSALDLVREWLVRGPLHLSGDQVQRYVDDLKAHVLGGAGGADIIGGAVRDVRVALEMAIGLVVTLGLTFYFVRDGEAIQAWALRQLPAPAAVRLAAVGNRAWKVLTGYVRGAAVNGLVNAVLMALGLFVLKVPLVAPIATLTFFGGFFPLVGAVAAGTVAALVALVSAGLQTALLVTGLTVVIHHVEGYLVGPVVLGRAVRLHTAVVIVALTAGTAVAGLVGAFLAVPVVAVAVAVVDEVRTTR